METQPSQGQLPHEETSSTSPTPSDSGIEPGLRSTAGDLEAGPLQKLILADLKWARQRYEEGAFDQFAGRYIAVANATSFGAGDDLGTLRQEAAREAGVAPERVALFYVDIYE